MIFDLQKMLLYKLIDFAFIKKFDAYFDEIVTIIVIFFL